MNLAQHNVIFNEENHTYFLNDVQLFGITGMLSRQLFPKKYANIPQKVLNSAAERGSKVHNDCRTFDMFDIIETPEAEMYAGLKEKHNIVTIENEYLVSDNEHFASAIDVVATVNEELSLCDIKTTSKLDKEYVSWQLSIYKYLFELQNPELEVKHLYAIYIRDKAELIEVDVIDKEVIKDLLNAEINGDQFVNPFQTEPPVTLPDSEQVLMLETAIIALKNEIKEYEEKKEVLLSTLKSEMERIGLDSWETDAMKITRVKPSVSNAFDSKTFQADYPETYKQYLKQTTRKGYIKITIKN